MYRIWYSTESQAEFVIANTILAKRDVKRCKLYESDANNPRNFHAVPDHIKQILYLDCPDIIVELDARPIFSVEFSTEAGTGHNAFQRFARLAASVENGVPAFYVYPEAVIVARKGAPNRWDRINPVIFKAMEAIMGVHGIPALLYYFPSDYASTSEHPGTSKQRASKGLMRSTDPSFLGCPDERDAEMRSMFAAMNDVIKCMDDHGVVMGREKLLGRQLIRERREWMNRKAHAFGAAAGSPVTATIEVSTTSVIACIERAQGGRCRVGELLRSRERTVFYCVDAAFRGDPYPGALAALDYMLCRDGRTFEERAKNLVLAWGRPSIDADGKLSMPSSSKASVQDFCDDVSASEARNILGKRYDELKNDEVPRYFMQARHGSTFSKSKHIRVYAYFADAILFKDGALWRDG